MRWLRRHSWWGLVAIAALLILFGVGDLLVGFSWDPGIPLGLVGLTPAELESASPDAYRLLEFGTRSGGLNLIFMGALFALVLFIGFRRDQRWAWWTMWLLPAWIASGVMLNVVFGVAAGQPPPPPLISGIVLGLVATGILAVSAPRFLSESRGS